MGYPRTFYINNFNIKLKQIEYDFETYLVNFSFLNSFWRSSWGNVNIPLFLLLLAALQIIEQNGANNRLKLAIENKCAELHFFFATL